MSCVIFLLPVVRFVCIRIMSLGFRVLMCERFLGGE
uniref:Uncharacterized protein n=1 Tax=Arundo donax TaxID=35708 RepID=A0A0A8Y221_ARUDO